MSVPLLHNGRSAAYAHVSRFHWFFNRTPNIPTALADLRLIEEACEATRGLMVRDMRAEGCTWDEVGDALGCSRQAAWQRYRTVTE